MFVVVLETIYVILLQHNMLSLKTCTYLMNEMD